MAGSFVEALTDELERQAEAYFARIESLGGVLACINRGYFQREIAESAYRYHQAVERREQIVVGVNAFREETDEGIPVLKINPSIEQEQVAALSLFRSRRDSLKVGAHLATLEKACRDPEAWLMPEILACVRVGATEGEIVQTMKRVLGTWREQPVF